jgi:uncharacterized membrane protein YjjP (DUF1212 family)
MKTWRIVTLVSFTFFLLMTAWIFSAPLQYPDARFSWRPVVIFLLPVFLILLLLLLRHRLTHRQFVLPVLAAAAVFIVLTLFGYMGPPILLVAAIACGAILVASRSLANKESPN